ncbi:MAG TPA: lipid A deacylase LpxR family protein [Alphaproteobacteria bacterium]
MTRRRVVAPLGVAFALALAALPWRPAPAQEPPRDTRGSFSIVIENDAFAGTDRHYTHGTRLAWLSAEDDLPGFGRWLARNLPILAAGGRKRIGYALGQNMYTPEDIDTTALQPDDRPYAGWLYGEIGVLSETGNRLDSVALSVGVVGPLSFAEDTQRKWHDWFGFQDPEGWDHQLENEPTLNLTFDRQWRYLWPFAAAGLDADVTPHLGLALGNAFTYAAAGATLRLGEALEADFGGPPRIRPSLPGAAHFSSPARFGWYLFAGLEARAVARDIFLDGNTFADGPGVDKRPLVGDLEFGFALVFERFRITYTQVFRSKEFYGQDEGDRFGAIAVTARF